MTIKPNPDSTSDEDNLGKFYESELIRSLLVSGGYDYLWVDSWLSEWIAYYKAESVTWSDSQRDWKFTFTTRANGIFLVLYSLALVFRLMLQEK